MQNNYMSFLGHTRRKLNYLCSTSQIIPRIWPFNNFYIYIYKLLYLKAHCLFAIKLYASRWKKLMYKVNQDTCNIMINSGNTLNQSWPGKDRQTLRLLHIFIWSCVWDPCTFVRKKTTTEAGVHCVTCRHWEFLNETKLFSPWWWQMHQQQSHFVAQKRQHTASWWQSWEHFRLVP